MGLASPAILRARNRLHWPSQLVTRLFRRLKALKRQMKLSKPSESVRNRPGRPTQCAPVDLRPSPAALAAKSCHRSIPPGEFRTAMLRQALRSLANKAGFAGERANGLQRLTDAAEQAMLLIGCLPRLPAATCPPPPLPPPPPAAACRLLVAHRTSACIAYASTSN